MEKFHHVALRCRDSEETRAFYEGFVGLRLAAALDVHDTQGADVGLHSFFALPDGSFLAFFDVPGKPPAAAPFDPEDIHFAFEVDQAAMDAKRDLAADLGIALLADIDHGMCRSIYFRDPNGYIVEFTVKLPTHDAAFDAAQNDARERLARWQAGKQAAPRANAGGRA